MQDYSFPVPEAATAVELYTTSTPSNIKTKKDCNRLRDLLMAKKISFVEIDLALQLWRRASMLKVSNGVSTLPQLHANGKYVGDLGEVQEMEDFGELNDALRPAFGSGGPTTAPMPPKPIPAASHAQSSHAPEPQNAQTDMKSTTELPRAPEEASGAAPAATQNAPPPQLAKQRSLREYLRIQLPAAGQILPISHLPLPRARSTASSLGDAEPDSAHAPREATGRLSRATSGVYRGIDRERDAELEAAAESAGRRTEDADSGLELSSGLQRLQLASGSGRELGLVGESAEAEGLAAQDVG